MQLGTTNTTYDSRDCIAARAQHAACRAGLLTTSQGQATVKAKQTRWKAMHRGWAWRKLAGVLEASINQPAGYSRHCAAQGVLLQVCHVWTKCAKGAWRVMLQTYVMSDPEVDKMTCL